MRNVFPSLPEKLGHHKLHIPGKQLPLEEIICLHSPFSSNIFYYIQLNKYSSGQALIKSLWNHPLYEIVQQPQVQNIAASP